MADLTPLTTGCLAEIIKGEEIERPIVQVLGTKRIHSGNTPERYRLLVSDGKYLHSFAMVATPMIDRVKQGSLDEFSIISIERYMTSVINKNDTMDKKSVLVIMDLIVLHAGSDVKCRIGNPITLNDDGTVNNSASKSQSMSSSLSTNNFPTPMNLNKTNNSNENDANLSDHLTHPISCLTPYQNKWVIKARVTAKSNVRSWSNAKGEGKLFSMDLMDETGEIRATAFKEQCDKFFDIIEIDKVYFISKCQLKPANKQYTKIKNDYEMTFTNETMVQECHDTTSVPVITYNFVPISQVGNIESNAIIDILGVCRDTSDIQQFTARTTGRELKKREITLVDTSNSSIQLTLWGDDAQNFDGISQPVILLKSVRVTEFGGGKSLGMIGGSTMKINPDIPDGHRLRGWFDNGGGENVVISLSARNALGGSYNTDWLTFHDVKLKNLGNGDKPDYFQCKAVVHIVKSSNAAYKSCPQTECNKKVIDQENGQYRCEKCNADFSTFKYRLLVNMSIGDWTSNRWVTCFNEVAEQLLGKDAQEIGDALDHNTDQVESIFGSINFKSFIFKLRTKVEFYGDSQRNKVTVVGAAPINYKEYNAYLIKNLQELTGIGRN